MKILQDFRYKLIELNGDEEAINILDGWLEDWIYRKEACPICGVFDENDETGSEPVEK